jgi:hydrogen cyanide synthase HcnB
LASLAGCKIAYKNKWQSWIPENDENMRTSVPGVYVAGDGAGVGGAVVAAHEGHIAGVSAAGELGYTRKSQIKTLDGSYRRLRSLKKYRAILDHIWAFKPGLYDVIQDDTLVCRCEEITFAEIKEAIAAGAEDVNQIKSQTRAGMGRCQARLCEVNITQLLSMATGMKPEKHRVRIPVKPIPIEALLSGR